MTITFLQLSDLHLAPPGQLLAGVDSMRQLRAVLSRIKQLNVAPAFIVVSGDLTDDGSAEAYEVVNEVLEEASRRAHPGAPHARQPRQPGGVPPRCSPRSILTTRIRTTTVS